MTLIERAQKRQQHLTREEIVTQFCPSDLGFVDPASCGGISCMACWSREFDGRERLATGTVEETVADVIRTVLESGATLPSRGHETDGGLDLYSREAAVIPPGGSKVFDTGVHMAIPRGFAGVLVSKSGLNVKSDCTSTGLIDADYTGSIAVKLYNQGDKDVHIAAKQKISQLVLVPIITPKPVQVDFLEDTERGDNGFGSTGAF